MEAMLNHEHVTKTETMTSLVLENADPLDELCSLPWGNIYYCHYQHVSKSISISRHCKHSPTSIRLLHAITASFHEDKDHYQKNKLERDNHKENSIDYNRADGGSRARY